MDKGAYSKRFEGKLGWTSRSRPYFDRKVRTLGFKALSAEYGKGSST